LIANDGQTGFVVVYIGLEFSGWYRDRLMLLTLCAEILLSLLRLRV